MRPAEKSKANTAASSGTWSPLGARFSINGALGASLVAIALAGIIVLSGFFSVVTSAFGRGMGSVQPADKLKDLVAKHEQEIKTWEERFNNRSVFFKPAAPYKPPPPPPPQIVDDTPKPPPGPPPPPSTYQGPPILFAYADVVYFNAPSPNDKSLRVQVGEEKSGVKVISTNLPWSVKLGNKGGEYDVPIFTKGEDFLKATPPSVILTPFLVSVPSSPAAPPVAEPPPVTPHIENAAGGKAASVPDGGAHTRRSARTSPRPTATPPPNGVRPAEPQPTPEPQPTEDPNAPVPPGTNPDQGTGTSPQAPGANPNGTDEKKPDETVPAPTPPPPAQPGQSSSSASANHIEEPSVPVTVPPSESHNQEAFSSNLAGQTTSVSAMDSIVPK